MSLNITKQLNIYNSNKKNDIIIYKCRLVDVFLQNKYLKVYGIKCAEERYKLN